MLVKALTLLVVFAAGAYLFRRAFVRPTSKDGQPIPLERCAHCGAFRKQGDLCDCERNPTP